MFLTELDRTVRVVRPEFVLAVLMVLTELDRTGRFTCWPSTLTLTHGFYKKSMNTIQRYLPSFLSPFLHLPSSSFHHVPSFLFLVLLSFSSPFLPLPSFLPAFLPSVRLSFLPSFIFLPSFLPSFGEGRKEGWKEGEGRKEDVL